MLGLENVKIVEAVAPVNTSGAAQTGNYVSLKGYAGCCIVIQTGAWAGGTSAVTINEATDVSATGAQALAFGYMYTNDGATTTSALTKTAVTSNTFNLDTANAMYVIDVKASSLTTTSGYDCISVALASPGSNNDYVSACYILYGSRFGDADGGIESLTN